MFDVSSFANRDTFRYWFIRRGVTDTWLVMDSDENVENSCVGVFNEQERRFDELNPGVKVDGSRMDDILADFHEFCKRPEYIVGKHIDSKLIDRSITNIDRINDMKDAFNDLIYGICYKSHKDDEVAKKYADRCIKWLQSTDFYIAPASTIYHDAEPCGLLRHTLCVVDKLIELLSIPSFALVDVAEAITVALVHDWCKIDFYEQYTKNVKDEVTGVWNKVAAYRYKGANYPFGHGVTSMFIAQKFFKLSAEQALAIRWHMGEHGVSDTESHDLMDANERYPMVLLLQCADRLAVLR